MGHYEDIFNADDEKEATRRQIRAAKTSAKINNLLEQLEAEIFQNGVAFDLREPLKNFQNTTIVWRYEEDLLEDTTELVLAKLSEE